MPLSDSDGLVIGGAAAVVGLVALAIRSRTEQPPEEEPQAKIDITDVVAPSGVAPGDTVRFEVFFENVGTASGGAVLDVFVNGGLHSSISVPTTDPGAAGSVMTNDIQVAEQTAIEVGGFSDTFAFGLLEGADIPVADQSVERDHFIWVRSNDGTPISFELVADNLHVDTDATGHDYWVTADLIRGGGTTSLQSGLPGFFYLGEIQSFEWTGNIDVFIDNSPVDPSQVVGGGDEELSGPPDNPSWTLTVDDHFDYASLSELDTSIWSVGWGWGRETNNGPAGVRDHAIRFENSLLILDILDDGQGSPYSVGALNTKDKVTIGPGTYVEARLRSSDLPGSNTAFWSKPNTEAWPPEIDHFGSLMRNHDRRFSSSHNIHWTTDGQPNGPHATENVSRSPGYDHSRRFTIFGCRWLEDSITMYADGQEFHRVTDPDIMRSLNNGAPFYVMLNTIIAGWLPSPPSDWSPYKTSAEVDWFRVWER